MNLDKFAAVVKEKEREFNRTLSAFSEEITLDDVLKQLEGKIPTQPTEHGWFKFELSSHFKIDESLDKIYLSHNYEISVSKDKIYLSGFNGILDRTFQEERIKGVYEKMLQDYEEIKKKDLPF
jgi:hypothetical protein